jgi:hypothetical protein
VKPDGLSTRVTYLGALEPDKVLLDLGLLGLHGVHEDSDPVAVGRQMVRLQFPGFVVKFLVLLARDRLLDGLEGTLGEHVALELDLGRVFNTRVMGVLSGRSFGVRNVDISVFLFIDIVLHGIFIRLDVFDTVIEDLILIVIFSNLMLFNLHGIIFVDIVLVDIVLVDIVLVDIVLVNVIVNLITWDFYMASSEIFILLCGVRGGRVFSLPIGHLDIIALVNGSSCGVIGSAAR